MADLLPILTEVCEACLVPELQSNIYICLSERFDVVLGKAVFCSAGKLRRRIGKKHAVGIAENNDEYVFAIILNNNVFWDVNNIGKTEIVVHEICHLIDFHLQLMETGKIVAEHNERWRRLMYACGFTPREYVPHHDLGLINKYKLHCSTCNMVFNTSRTKHTRVKRETSHLYCRSCSGKLRHLELLDTGLDNECAV